MTLKPSLEDVEAIIAAKKGNTIPVYAQIHADLLTPVGAYLRIAEESDYSFLFESVAGGEKIGRYSFLGAGELAFFSLFVVRTGKYLLSADGPMF